MGFLILIIIIWLIALTSAFFDFKSNVLSRLEILSSELYQKHNSVKIEPAEDKYNISPDNFIKNDGIEENIDIKNIKDEFSEFDFKTKNKDESKDIESLFFGNIFNKIGAVVLIIAFGIFLKFVSEHIEFTPLLKIVLSVISGAGMVFGAVYLFKTDKMRNYASALMGAGFGVLFITAYCAFALYQMLNIYTASLSAILLLIFSYLIAKKYKSISTFIIGLIGAYLSPVIIGSNSLISINYLFSYLIFVNLVSIAYVSEDSSKTPLNYVNMVITTVFAHIWAIKSGKPLIILPFIFWAVYLLFDMYLIKLMPKNKTYLCWVNFAVAASFLILNYFENEKYLVSLGTLLIGLIYSLCGRLIYKHSKDSALQYKNGSFFALYSAVWFIPSYLLKMFSFVISGVLISFLSKEKDYLQKWGFTFIISSFVMVFSTGALFSDNITEYLNYRYIFNTRTLFYLVPAIGAICVSKFCRKFPLNLSDFLYFIGISFCYLFIATEINILMLKLQNADITRAGFNYIKNISYVILGIIYSLQLKRIGKTSSLQIFNYTAYTAFVISSLALVILSFLMPDCLYYPVINIRTFAIILAVIASVFYEYKERINYFGYFAVFLGLYLINLECYKILELLNAYNLGIISTSLWMIYAGILIVSGIFFNIKICKMSGIFIVVTGLLKIFIIDTAGVEAIYKIIAFLITGVILMLTSYYYTKKKN